MVYELVKAVQPSKRDEQIAQAIDDNYNKFDKDLLCSPYKIVFLFKIYAKIHPTDHISTIN